MMKLKKTLIVCGPTATGKTKLALALAGRYNGELIAADSRQLYRELNVLTGKDIPKGFMYRQSLLTYRGRSLGYFGNGTKLWLVDIAKPTEVVHAALFRDLAICVRDDIWRRRKLPIIVGGTGLYLAAVARDLLTVNVPQNPKLRVQLEQLSLSQLQQELEKLDKKRWESMNHSDSYNPRRLIRAIEIAVWNKDQGNHSLGNKPLNADVLWIGLIAPIAFLERKVAARVKARWYKGAVAEVAEFAEKWDRRLPAASALGFGPIRRYLNGEISEEQARQLWVRAERAYAKRQMTWFKKQSGIHWFNITTHGWQNQVVALVQEWYTE